MFRLTPDLDPKKSDARLVKIRILISTPNTNFSAVLQEKLESGYTEEESMVGDTNLFLSELSKHAEVI